MLRIHTSLAVLVLCLFLGLARAQETEWDRYVRVGDTAFLQGDYFQAERMFLRALELAESSTEERLIAISLNLVGRVYVTQGRYTEAQSLLERSLSMKEKHVGRKDPSLIEDLRGLATAYGRQGMPLEAMPLLERALAIADDQETEHPDLFKILSDLATVYVEIKRFDDALALFQRSVQTFAKTPGAAHPELATVLLAASLGNPRGGLAARPSRSGP